VFERFTDRARRVLVLAQERARILENNFIGTEHLLLGLLDEGEGIAAQVLRSAGVSDEKLTEEIKKRNQTTGSAFTGSPPFTPRAKKVLELALRESLDLGSNYIGTEHILLGLVREGEGGGVAALIGAGVDPADLRRRLLEIATERRRGATPRCSSCRERLEGRIGYRTLPVPSVDDPPRPPITVPVVFCRSCGVVVNPPPKVLGP
jgi:ATP-dependent Clp protease ATP-binding subunit ClpC